MFCAIRFLNSKNCVANQIKSRNKCWLFTKQNKNGPFQTYAKKFRWWSCFFFLIYIFAPKFTIKCVFFRSLACSLQSPYFIYFASHLTVKLMNRTNICAIFKPHKFAYIQQGKYNGLNKNKTVKKKKQNKNTNNQFIRTNERKACELCVSNERLPYNWIDIAWISSKYIIHA